MSPLSFSIGWKTRRRLFVGFALAVFSSTLLLGFLSDAEWLDQVAAGVQYLPSIPTFDYWKDPIWGQGRNGKPTVKTFLAAYNGWKNSSGEGYCTPSLDQITVKMDGTDINHLEGLDVSIPHYLEIQSWCDGGIPGVGDFYEALLTTPFYHGRIPLYNQFNGIQIGEPLRIPSEMVAQGHPLRLQIWRLYREFEGIENHQERRAPFADGKYTREEIVDMDIPLEGLLGRSAEDRPICHGKDFEQHEWTGGFWWRKEETDESWTFYLANCKAKKFTTEEASECLAGRKFVYLGDSTAQDMLRNTFWTLLGDAYPAKTNLPPDFHREGHWNTTHPGHPERWTSISMLFNGHFDLMSNRLGMKSFRNQKMIDRHDKFFDKLSQSKAEIDTILVNSGLHDCWARWTPEGFAEDFEIGWEYYVKKFDEISERQVKKPQIVWRYSNTPPVHLNATLATPMNPSSMEMVNMIEREYLHKYNMERMGGRLTYLDSFEPTWPWHFDGEMNSGPHYGRAPWGGTSKRLVDVMMVQLFFTRLCPDIAVRG